MMKTRLNGTERPKNGTGGLRRVVLALAVLLLTCVLTAGAVSADDDVATVDNYDALIAALADDTKSSITLTANIDATAEILVNRSVTIDGAGHKITAITDPWPKGNDKKHLLGIMKKTDATNDITVTLKNLKLDSASKAMGLNIFEPGETVTLTDLTLTNSAGSGITINGATVKASGLTISGSKWGQSIDVGLGTAEIVKTSSLTLSGTNTLSDVYQINTDNPDAVTVTAPGYKSYDWFYDYTDNSGYHPYAHYKSTWTTKSDFTTVDLPKEADKKAPVLVLNSSTATPALHKDLVNATKYVEDGATIQLLGDVELKETAEVTNGVTLDLNGHTISSSDTAISIGDNNAKLTVMNSATTGGVISSTSSSGSPAKLYNGTLTLKSGVTLSANMTSGANGDGLSINASSAESDISKVIIEKGAVVTGPYGIYVYQNSNSPKHDVTIDVYGTVNGILFIDGDHLDQNTYPKVNVYDGAVLNGGARQGIAMQGVCLVTVHGGTITGGEAIGVKGGKLVIHDGTFTATGAYVNPVLAEGSGTEESGSTIALTNSYLNNRAASIVINGGEFVSTNGHALLIEASCDRNSPHAPLSNGNVSELTITDGIFKTENMSLPAISVNQSIFTPDAKKNIIGGKYSKPMNTTVLTLPTGYIIIDDGSYQTVAKKVTSPTAVVTTDAITGTTTVDVSDSTSSLEIVTTVTEAESVVLTVGGDENVKVTLYGTADDPLAIDTSAKTITGNVTRFTYLAPELELQNGNKASFVMHFDKKYLAAFMEGQITFTFLNAPASGDYSGDYAAAISVKIDGASLEKSDVGIEYTQKRGYTYKVIHAKDGSQNNVVFTYAGGKFKFIAPSFSSYVITETPTPASTSSGGSSAYSFRVLFNDGSTTLSVVTDLSYGDKLTKPATPVKDGYTFAGWYKDSACTQAWDFETGIPGDMTLYAKWTAAGSSGETEATTAPTATSTAVTTPQPTKTQSTTATTSAPQATTAAGVSPTLTQAPAPVAGALFGLLAAGVLLRRRFQ